MSVQHARDITDEDFLSAVRTAMTLRDSIWATRWDVAAVLAGHPERVSTGDVFGDDIDEAVPPKVVLAKAKRLISRDLLQGCTCGCRGDFEPI